jgi:hypothetical protein
LNIVSVETVLAKDPLKLVPPSLLALQASETLYTVLALQPQGRIQIDDNGIRNADAADVSEKIRRFFDLALEMPQMPDLLICPEYCVPWDVLLRLIESGAGPKPGKLWVLGCESLPLGQLQTYRERLGDRAVIIDEGETDAVITTQRYRNPLVYLFTTNSRLDEKQHLVMLVQYKTAPSGDQRNTEARGMLAGQDVYLFGTPPSEVRLMTLVCSDVFGLTDKEIKDYYDGLLLLHVQLNPNPRHTLYKQYRPRFFACGGRTELFCLNWAAGIAIVRADGGPDHAWNNIGGSAWYLRPTTFDCSDETIGTNHKQGFYYTWYKPLHVHALHLHYEPRVFHFVATKVFHHGVERPRSYLLGPRIQRTFHWSEANKEWAPSAKTEELPVDGFTELLAGAGTDVSLEDLATVYAGSPIDVERVLAIAAGEFGPSANWYEPQNIDSMQLCEDEVVRRITVTIDPDARSFRSLRISAARQIAALRSTAFTWPSEVGCLQQGFTFGWSKDSPTRNVTAADGTLATAIYLGAVGDPDQLERLDQRARQTVAGHPPEPAKELSEEELREHRRAHFARVQRLCILYTHGADLRVYRSANAAPITSPAGSSPVDITVPAAPRSADAGLGGSR